MKAVQPFFQPMGRPQPYDWLTTFKEAGQTFDEYISSNPTLPTAERSVLYAQPLGRFDAKQKKVIDASCEYLEAFYGLRVKKLSTRPLLAKLSDGDQRLTGYPSHRQVRTGWVMENMLKPNLPPDAAAMIAFTDEDLFPDSSITFVFGQASLEDRVGVWSLFRLDEQADFNTFRTCTLKIAAHEVGHVFSFRHCTKYECVMSGSNHVAETDRRPIDACPECMAKIAWMRNETPADRYRRLIDFAKRNKLNDAAADFARKLASVE